MITELNEFDGALLTWGGQTFGLDLHPGSGPMVEVSPAVYTEQMQRGRDAIDPLLHSLNEAIAGKIKKYDEKVGEGTASRHGMVPRPQRRPYWMDVLEVVRIGITDYEDLIVRKCLQVGAVATDGTAARAYLNR